MAYRVLWDDAPDARAVRLSPHIRALASPYGDASAAEEILGLRDDVQELVLNDIATRLSADPHQGSSVFRLLPSPHHIAHRIETVLSGCHALYQIDEATRTVTVLAVVYPRRLRRSL